MFNAVNYLAVNGMCCCLNLCCKEVWETLYKLIGKNAFVKFAYCVVYFSTVFLSILSISLISEWSWFMENLAPGIQCNRQIQFINCLSSSVVYRSCSALLLLSVCMLCIMLACPTRTALIFNEGLFFSKFVIVGLLTMFFMQMDNSYFLWFGWVSRIFSYAFVVIQSIILIDLAFLWGINWARNYSAGRNKYAFFLILFTLVMFALTFYFIISRFQHANHQQLAWADYLCLIQIILMVGVQLLNFNKQNSLLTTAALCILVAYSTWSAGYSHPSSPVDQDIIYLNMAIYFVLLMVSTGGSIYGKGTAEKNGDNEVMMVDVGNIDSQYGNLNVEERMEQAERDRGMWIQWLVYLSGMSMYMAMIVTDWGSADLINHRYNLTTEAWTSKLVMGSVIFVVYCWTLVAPRVCPNRNFYFE